ncbi:XylR N-terminal domain-containing protein [Peribacillus sp. NPDC101480]|uniref:XylR N-terminal domain-containing protein n=1 Tax=Peribacillus sp. NPDC101480 TaxID=3390620 RepID=UPI003D062620
MTNLLNLKNDEGEIHLNDERMILTSSSIFGTLRKDLIENIGFERMKSFLIRYGWNIGVNDAKKGFVNGKGNTEARSNLTYAAGLYKS